MLLARLPRHRQRLAVAVDAHDLVPRHHRFAGETQRLLDQRDAYYEELERAQHGPLDVTPWVTWFVTQVHAASEVQGTQVPLLHVRFSPQLVPLEAGCPLSTHSGAPLAQARVPR